MTFPRYPKYKPSGVQWVGNLPDSWHVTPLLAVACERNESNEDLLEQNLLSLSYGSIVRKDIMAVDGLLPESFDTYQIVHPGDIVLRLTDLQNDKRSLRSAIVPERGIITSAYVCVAPKTINAGYLAYLMRAYDVSKVFYSLGGGLRQSMKYEDLKRLPIIVPSDPEQAAIVAFLDEETGKIDALVAEQERLIELLKEKRQAVISHAVTKGLNPDAPMKPSGLEWLGDVPAHWQCGKLGRFCKLRGGFAFPGERFGLEGTAVVRMNNLRRGRLDLAEAVRIPDDFCAAGAALEEGDLVWGMSGSTGDTGSLGNFARVRTDDLPCQLNQRVGKFVVEPSKITSDFLEWMIQTPSFYEQVLLFVTGTAQFNVSSEQVESCLGCIPSLGEQAAIVRHLNATIASFDTLIAEATRAVALLKERRSVLISAAVSGQIDVWGLV